MQYSMSHVKLDFLVVDLDYRKTNDVYVNAVIFAQIRPRPYLRM